MIGRRRRRRHGRKYHGCVQYNISSSPTRRRRRRRRWCDASTRRRIPVSFFFFFLNIRRRESSHREGTCVKGGRRRAIPRIHYGCWNYGQKTHAHNRKEEENFFQLWWDRLHDFAPTSQAAAASAALIIFFFFIRITTCVGVRVKKERNKKFGVLYDR